MVLAWQPIRVDTGPDEGEVYTADPAEVLAMVAELLERPAWHRLAACRGKGPDDWFPNQGGDTRPARAVCAGCAVQSTCLDAGMREHYGIWSSTSAVQRRKLRGIRAA